MLWYFSFVCFACCDIFRFHGHLGVDSYEVTVVKYEYVKINNISCIFSKMAAKMAAEN